jgi:transposase
MQVYIGIDWSKSKHDICIQNAEGIVLAEFCVPHSSEGFACLAERIRDLGTVPQDCCVAIECSYTLLIDFLWANGFVHIWVAPPNRVKAERQTRTSSGAKSDPGDAGVIADLVRTKRNLLQPWSPGSAILQRIQIQVRHVGNLTRDIVRQTNRLRDLLLRYYPAAATLFSSLDTQISLHFLMNFPTPQEASGLTWDTFRQFVRQHRYSHLGKLTARFSHLQKNHLQADPVTSAAFRAITIQTAETTLALVQAKNHALKELKGMFEQHPLASIFASLPGAGAYLAPALLAKLGEDPARFPSPSALQMLAGTCPVTNTSGKRRRVLFRRSCDHEFRSIVQQWAKTSLSESPWAQMYFRQVRPRCQSDNHAYRCLANRWLTVLWTLWQQQVPYDENRHLKERAARKTES